MILTIINLQVLSNLRSLTSFLLGISAAILNLESLSGFLYYILGSSLVSLLIHFLLAKGEPGKYFPGNGDRGLELNGRTGRVGGSGRAWRDVWLGGGVLTEGLSGFILGWAGVGGVIR
jgi:ER membrane protein complex subunit 6